MFRILCIKLFVLLGPTLPDSFLLMTGLFHAMG